MENTRAIIDYAYDDNAKDMRDALYSDIHDRVMSHLDIKRQEIAQGMLNSTENVVDSEQEQEQESENT